MFRWVFPSWNKDIDNNLSCFIKEDTAPSCEPSLLWNQMESVFIAGLFLFSGRKSCHGFCALREALKSTKLAHNGIAGPSQMLFYSLFGYLPPSEQRCRADSEALKITRVFSSHTLKSQNQILSISALKHRLLLLSTFSLSLLLWKNV